MRDSAQKKVMLIVEDDSWLLADLSNAFEKAGYRVVAVSDFKAALASLEKEPFDAVLSDWNFPSVPGCLASEVSGAALEREAVARSIPIVVMSGQWVFSAVDKLGAAGFIPKPFDKNIIVQFETLIEDAKGAERV